jgi:peptidoglycan/LPS O-acetylase OafA/YrhL
MINSPPSPSLLAESQRVPSLDGLRGISILLVLFGHLNGTHNFFNIDTKKSIGDVSALGVSVFFVISGYLITKLLIKEKAKNNTINLKYFYVRRLIRLSPCLISYLITIAILSSIGIIHINNRDWFFAITYTMNYNITRSWQVGHLWSLSIEEQFYFIWPIIFNISQSKAFKYAKYSIVIAILFRIALRFFIKTPVSQMEIFPVYMDSIAIGCLLANYQEQLHTNPTYLKILNSKLFLLVPILILIINRFNVYSICMVFGTFIVNILIMISIDRYSTINNNTSFNFLNSKLLSSIGKMSYSIYIWQQLFLNRASSAPYCKFPNSIVLVVSASLISYFLIEKSFLRFNKNFRT